MNKQLRVSGLRMLPKFQHRSTLFWDVPMRKKERKERQNNSLQNVLFLLYIYIYIYIYICMYVCVCLIYLETGLGAPGAMTFSMIILNFYR